MVRGGAVGNEEAGGATVFLFATWPGRPRMTQTASMQPQTIAAGWLTLRPFSAADMPWVYDVWLPSQERPSCHPG